MPRERPKKWQKDKKIKKYNKIKSRNSEAWPAKNWLQSSQYGLLHKTQTLAIKQLLLHLSNEWMIGQMGLGLLKTTFLETWMDQSKAELSNQELDTDLLSPNKLQNLRKRPLNILSCRLVVIMTSHAYSCTWLYNNHLKDWGFFPLGNET